MELNLGPTREHIEQANFRSKADESAEMQVVPTETDTEAVVVNQMLVSQGAENAGNSVTLSSKALKRCLSVPIPRSQPPSREVSPAPVFNIFAPRGRRYSASYSPARGGVGAASCVGMSTVNVTNAVGGSTGNGSGQTSRCVTPRISQLRQEECVDGHAREVSHEREVHSAIQISQSWEDLSIVAESWSCKSSDELSNPLQVVVGLGMGSSANGCSSPSPTNNRANLRLPYGLSPSPTRRCTFATRRSMSPIAIRPSQLGPVKRKFDMDDTSATTSAWSSLYSQPPTKKMFCDSRGSSPICQSPSSSVCPSPDSGNGAYDGRITPKLLISKLCTHNVISMNHINNTNSACSSPMSASSCSDVNEAAGTIIAPHLCSSSSSSSSSSSIANSTVSSNSEPMSLGSSSLDEGISLTDKISEEEEPLSTSAMQPAAIQDESTLMDIIKPNSSQIMNECSKMIVDTTIAPIITTAMDDKL